MSEITLIVNRYASRVTEQSIRAVEAALAAAGRVTVLPTSGPGHAAHLTREAGARSDALVVFSGDGGFNEALNGMEDDVPVGFVPGGGTSVLPRALGLPRDPARAADQIAGALTAGRTRAVSLGRANGRRFAFAAGLGVDAELIRRVNARGRLADGRRPGDVYFAWTLARLLAEHRGRLEPALDVVGHGRAAFAFVANTDPYTFLGRLPVRISPAARFDLGLDLVAPVAVLPRQVPRLLTAMVRGGFAYGAPNILHLHDVERVELVCDWPMPLQVDGEDLGDVTRAMFTVDPSPVRVLV